MDTSRGIPSEHSPAEDNSTLGGKFFEDFILGIQQNLDAQILAEFARIMGLRAWCGCTRLRLYLWQCVQETLLKPYLENILALKSWRPHVRKSVVNFKPHAGDKWLGWCNYRPDQIGSVMVHCTGELAEDISTIIHELAHDCVRWRMPFHGMDWRLSYVKAAREFTNNGHHVELDLVKRSNDRGFVQDAYVRGAISDWLHAKAMACASDATSNWLHNNEP